MTSKSTAVLGKSADPYIMEAAREQAAQCWCDDRVSDRTFDPELCEVVAEAISVYMRTQDL
jgi:hypothetical protein